MRIRKPSDTWLREESATVLLPSLIFASLQWLESQDAKRCTAIKEKTLLLSVPGFSICYLFSESISPILAHGVGAAGSSFGINSNFTHTDLL